MRRALWLAASIAAGAAAIWYFYRGFFRSGFRLTQGANGDGRLTAVVANHWQDPFQFAGGLVDLGNFYPYMDGLRYSDTLMAFGIIAAPFTRMGIEPIVAFQWSLIIVSAIGYGSTIAFLRTGPRTPWPIAIAAGLIVVFANGMVVGANHPQLLAVALLPPIAVAYLLAHRAAGSIASFALAAVAGGLFGIVAYSAFYVGWFAAVGVVMALAIWLLLLRQRRWLAALVGPNGRTLWGFLAGAAPFIVLFAWTYGPLLLAGAGRSAEEVRSYALAPQDLLGASPTNALWFKPLYALFGDIAGEERGMAPTPLLLAAGIAMMVTAIVLAQRIRTPWMAAGVACLVTGLVLWLLPVDWGWMFPWQAVMAIPGADAIRAIGRVELIAGAAIAIGSSIIAGELWRHYPRSLALRVVTLGVLVLVVIEQANYKVQQAVDVGSVERIRALEAPPIACTSFALLPPFPERAGDGQTDAAIIAQEHGIPTWNGSSGGVPDGWDLPPMDDPPAYLAALGRYAAERGLTGACAVSLADGRWRTLDDVFSAIPQS